MRPSAAGRKVEPAGSRAARSLIRQGAQGPGALDPQARAGAPFPQARQAGPGLEVQRYAAGVGRQRGPEAEAGAGIGERGEFLGQASPQAPLCRPAAEAQHRRTRADRPAIDIADFHSVRLVQDSRPFRTHGFRGDDFKDLCNGVRIGGWHPADPVAR